MCFIGLSARAQPLHPRTISVEWKDSFILEVAWVFHRARTRVYGGFRYFYFHPSLCLGMDLGMKWKRYGQNANA